MERTELPRPMPVTARRRYQITWVVLSWLVTGLSLVSLLYVIVVPPILGVEIPAVGLFTAATSSVATVLGSAMATHLVARGVGSVDFDDATSTMRVVVVAYALVQVTVAVILLGAVDWDRPSLRPDAIEDMASLSQGVAAQVFGAAALFLVVGEGFSKYRRLLASHPRRPSTASR